jgi:flagellar biosynthetic protein FliQ
MLEEDVAAMLRESVLLMVKLGGPILLAALAVGLVMSLIQAATQISEQTLTFVPKVLAIAAAVMLAGSFMLAAMTDFAHLVFDRMVLVGGT